MIDEADHVGRAEQVSVEKDVLDVQVHSQLLGARNHLRDGLLRAVHVPVGEVDVDEVEVPAHVLHLGRLRERLDRLVLVPGRALGLADLVPDLVVRVRALVLLDVLAPLGRRLVVLLQAEVDVDQVVAGRLAVRRVVRGLLRVAPVRLVLEELLEVLERLLPLAGLLPVAREVEEVPRLPVRLLRLLLFSFILVFLTSIPLLHCLICTYGGHYLCRSSLRSSLCR